MFKLGAALTGLLFVAVGGIAAIAMAVGTTTRPLSASPVALAEIPSSLLPVYVKAAATCAGLDWTILAAIGAVESGHGQGRLNDATGNVVPPIEGPALNGQGGYAEIRDPSSHDGWAHARGPMQFLTTTWAAWARLAPGRPAGQLPSIDNAWDAIYTAAAYLCDGNDRLDDLDRAILRYNPSHEYRTTVKAKAATYGQLSGGGGACPVAGPVEFRDDFGEPRSEGRTHQGNDVFAAHGTPLLALEAGTIDWTNPTDDSIGGLDLRTPAGDDWYYAHLSTLAVEPGQHVTTGQIIGWVGDTGNATGGPPHLHVEHHQAGKVTNPFAVLVEACVAGL